MNTVIEHNILRKYKRQNDIILHNSQNFKMFEVITQKYVKSFLTDNSFYSFDDFIYFKLTEILPNFRAWIVSIF